MPYYPAQEIKSKIGILDLFKRDGHQLKRSGHHYFCLCPLHQERTPSCCVTPSKNYFFCFGCNKGGDIFKYWQFTRGVDFITSLEDLAAIAGIDGISNPHTVTPVQPQKTKQMTQVAPPPPKKIDQKLLKEWAAACESLLSSEEDIQRLAKWRSFSPSLIKWAAREQLLGCLNYRHQLRDAFMLKSPSKCGRFTQSAAFHVHIADNLGKSSWRLHPQGGPSWPLVTGKISSAQCIFITEGPWDALALCQIMQWHNKTHVFENISIIGLTGSSNTKHLFNYNFPPSSTFIVIADSDAAGDKWFEDGGLIEQLESKQYSVYGYRPNSRNSDLNDRLRDGIDRTKFLNSIADYPEENTSLRSILLNSFKK